MENTDGFEFHRSVLGAGSIAGYSLGTRPSLAEEEEGLVNLHTYMYKFEVRGISAE